MEDRNFSIIDVKCSEVACERRGTSAGVTVSLAELGAGGRKREKSEAVSYTHLTLPTTPYV